MLEEAKLEELRKAKVRIEIDAFFRKHGIVEVEEKIQALRDAAGVIETHYSTSNGDHPAFSEAILKNEITVFLRGNWRLFHNN